MESADDATMIAERVIESFSGAFDLDEKRVIIGASVGIATNARREDTEALLANADVAMYAAKARGKGCYEIFRPGMRIALQERVELQSALEDALGLDQLILHYQPIVDLVSRRIIGVEALVRWMHPERGLVPPAAFIPMAEETGLILPLGRWVLRTACLQARQWQIAHPQDPPLTVSVNLSARQYQDDALVADVETALEEAGIPANSLVLEITETTLMRDTEGTVERLDMLKGLGVQLAVDDFGTGYSSLSYLRRFPVDRLKIDRSFVSVMTDAPEDVALVQAVLKLAEGLGLEAVAEGIERPDQLEALRKLGCRVGQGFLFAAPVPPTQLEFFLASGIDPISITEEVPPRESRPGVVAGDEGTGEAR
jgi:predicted signal transduction protein with EAL and GGDEF domain